MGMECTQAVRMTEHFTKEKLKDDVTGHDWWHIDRVRKMALEIAKKEKADAFVVELAALLHDIADWKFHADEQAGGKVAREFLEKIEIEKTAVNHICEIIDNISFKGSGVKSKISTIEGKCVQDADRIDALGAIGIARAFAYGGLKQRQLYDPAIKPVLHQTFQDYKNSKSSTINHFFEKLLLLKDLMNTETGKKMAEKRHQFTESFLQEFFNEWKGNI
jgi:uncharacterized protein